jgi:hypothetical protein
MFQQRCIFVFFLQLKTDIFSKKSLKIPKGGNQKPYIKEDQTAQWPKEKVQKDKQRSTKHTHKTKDRNLYTIFHFLFGDSSC